MKTNNYLFLKSSIIPDYFIIIGTVNYAILRVIKTGLRLNITISFDKDKIEILIPPDNCCKTITQTKFIEHLAVGFTPQQLKTINKLFKTINLC